MPLTDHNSNRILGAVDQQEFHLNFIHFFLHTERNKLNTLSKLAFAADLAKAMCALGKEKQIVRVQQFIANVIVCVANGTVHKDRFVAGQVRCKHDSP